MTCIYVFGSICRGEVTPGSDVDLLAVTEGYDPRFDPAVYSIYSASRLAEIWAEGNPFAWHLARESKLVFSSDGQDVVASLGMPVAYAGAKRDCRKFYDLFESAAVALRSGTNSPVFELSTVFLAVRNFATCYSLGCTDTPDFSRHSALQMSSDSLRLPAESFALLERARLLCTRGIGEMLTVQEAEHATAQLELVREWMRHLMRQAEDDE